MKWQNGALLAAAVLINGCAWVDLTERGRTVRVMQSHEVMGCKKLGNTTVTVAETVGGLKRQPHIVANNLETLARNAGADMQGDTVVAASPVNEGRQKFDVYQCGGN